MAEPLPQTRSTPAGAAPYTEVIAAFEDLPPGLPTALAPTGNYAI